MVPSATDFPQPKEPFHKEFTLITNCNVMDFRGRKYVVIQNKYA